MRKIGLLGNDQSLAPVQDLLASDAGFLGKKGGIANEHFEQDNAEGPPVNSFGVSILAKDLGRYVIGGSYR